MTNPKQIQAYADQLAPIYGAMANLAEDAKGVIASAKDDGFTTKDLVALRKAAKEMIMEPGKRQDKYDAEHQLEMFREVLKLTAMQFAEAAE